MTPTELTSRAESGPEDNYLPQHDRAVMLAGALLVAIGVAFATLLSLLGGNALPERFTRDDAQIRLYMLDVPQQLRQTSYGQTARFYNDLGMSSDHWIRTVAAVAMLAIIFWKCRSIEQAPRMWPYISVFASLVLAGVYLLPVYSKDFFVLPLVVAFVLLPDSLAGEIAWVALAFGYGDLIRANWVAVAALYVVFRVLLHRTKSLRSLTMKIVVLMLVLTVVFEVFYGKDLHYYRYSQGSGLAPDVRSVITDPLPSGNTFSTCLNGLYSFATFMFPVPLALLLSPFYIAVAVFLGVDWWRAFRLVLPLLERPRLAADRRMWRTLALLLSATLVQSLYAPDWGSYTRHMTPFFPLFALIVVTSHQAASVDRIEMTSVEG